MTEKDEVYEEYKNSVNMTYSELKEWKDNPCSKKASLSRKPINRNLRLLKKNKSEWTKKDVEDAKRTISFIARARGQNRGEPVCDGLSKRDIALLNWAYDPR